MKKYTTKKMSQKKMSQKKITKKAVCSTEKILVKAMHLL